MTTLLRWLPRRRRGKRSVPVHLRPLPSWPRPQDPWAASAETIVLPRAAGRPDPRSVR
jgi:hypothetical protein